MKFRRKSDGQLVTARQWFRHGDHPSVKPATADDAPNLTSLARFGVIGDRSNGRAALVFPADWIIELADFTIALNERVFRTGYEPTPE